MANEPVLINLPVTEDIGELRKAVEMALQRLALRIEDGQLSKNLDAAGNQIKNVRWPTDDKDAVNVEYLKDFFQPKKLNRRQAFRLQSTTTISGNDSYFSRAIYPAGVVVVGNDQCPSPYIVTCPTGYKVQLIRAIGSVSVAPTGTNLIADVKRATAASPTTFASIFTAGASNQVEIAVGNTVVTQVIFDIAYLNEGDRLRDDVTQAGGAAADLGVELFGVFVPI